MDQVKKFAGVETVSPSSGAVSSGSGGGGGGGGGRKAKLTPGDRSSGEGSRGPQQQSSGEAPTRAQRGPRRRPAVRDKLNQNEFVIERIVKYKKFKKVRYAKIKWEGYSQTTWEPVDQIFDYERKEPAEVMEPESVVGVRTRKGNVEYKVHWKGMASIRDAWVRKFRIRDHQHLIDEYLAEHPNEGRGGKGSRRQPQPRTGPAVLAIKRGVPKSEDDPSKVPFTTSKSSIDQEMSKPEIRIKSEPFPPPDDDYIGIGNDFGLPSPIVVPKSLDNDNGEPLESVTVHDDIRGVDSFHTEKSNGAPRRSRPAAPASFNFKVPEVPRFSVENKPIADWSVAEVAAFLTHRGFPDAAAKILERQVDGRRLLGALDPLMLKKMEIPIGPGLKITKLMRDLQKLWVGSV